MSSSHALFPWNVFIAKSSFQVQYSLMEIPSASRSTNCPIVGTIRLFSQTKLKSCCYFSIYDCLYAFTFTFTFTFTLHLQKNNVEGRAQTTLAPVSLSTFVTCSLSFSLKCATEPIHSDNLKWLYLFYVTLTNYHYYYYAAANVAVLLYSIIKSHIIFCNNLHPFISTYFILNFVKN